MTPPEKIFFEPNGQYIHDGKYMEITEFDIEYIRADKVEQLVEALRDYMTEIKRLFDEEDMTINGFEVKYDGLCRCEPGDESVGIPDMHCGICRTVEFLREFDYEAPK